MPSDNTSLWIVLRISDPFIWSVDCFIVLAVSSVVWRVEACAIVLTVWSIGSSSLLPTDQI